MSDQTLLELPKKVDQFQKFPGTRYMGSKRKIINAIWEILSQYKFHSFFDAFSGSNIVSYFMKTKDKKVVTNDFMSMSYYMSKAIIENDNVVVSDEICSFLMETSNDYKFINQTFSGIYFTDDENQFLDRVRGNIESLADEYQKAIAVAALVRACMKKRPRGIFTYTGNRYDDGRVDVKKSLRSHFVESVKLLNQAVFSNEYKCKAHNENIFDLKQGEGLDLVYLDPPYYNPKGDNDYVRRYHFVEGIAKYWNGLEIQEHTTTKKFKSYKTPFSVKREAYNAFENLITSYQDSIIAISYSSNSLPTKEEMINLIKKYKNKIAVHEISHTYSFGNQKHKIGNKNNRVKEYLFIAE